MSMEAPTLNHSKESKIITQKDYEAMMKKVAETKGDLELFLEYLSSQGYSVTQVIAKEPNSLQQPNFVSVNATKLTLKFGDKRVELDFDTDSKAMFFKTLLVQRYTEIHRLP